MVAEDAMALRQAAILVGSVLDDVPLETGETLPMLAAELGEILLLGWMVTVAAATVLAPASTASLIWS